MFGNRSSRRGRAPGNVLDTGEQAVLSNDETTPVFNPMTPSLPTGGTNEVRVTVWLAAVGATKVRPAIEFSDDGVNYTDAAKELDATYLTSADEGFTYGDSFVSLFTLPSTTPRRFMRLGVQALNTTTGGNTESAQARLLVERRPIRSRSIMGRWTKVHTLGDTVNKNFIPMCDAVETDFIKELRFFWELAGSSGDLVMEAAYQETDTPDDLSSWSTPEAVGSAVSSEGVVSGTTFTSVSLTKKFLRAGFLVYNDSGSDIEAARAWMLMEARD